MLLFFRKENPEQIIYTDTDVRKFRETEHLGPLLEHRYFVSFSIYLITTHNFNMPM